MPFSPLRLATSQPPPGNTMITGAQLRGNRPGAVDDAAANQNIAPYGHLEMGMVAKRTNHDAAFPQLGAQQRTVEHTHRRVIADSRAPRSGTCSMPYTFGVPAILLAMLTRVYAVCGHLRCG